MAKIILLCGKIASGKTTFAQNQKNGSTIVLSVDECMLELQKTCMGRAAHVQMEEGILAYFYRLSEQLVAQGFHVIIDHGYWLKKERAMAMHYFQSRHIPIELYYFPISDEEQKIRLCMRNQTKGKDKQYHIEQDKCEYLNQFFEALDSEELRHARIIT